MRTGVFGGTFDPPHLGHLIVAGDAHAALGLDRVMFIPAAVPPHKRVTVRASAEHRLAMVRAAIRGDDRFEVDDLELRRAGPSYTVDTLRALLARRPGGELFFLLGVDALREIGTWKAPGEVARLATLVALSREGEGGGCDSRYPVHPVRVTRIDISATEVRRRVGAGEPIRYLVPDAVREIIRREGLYERQG